MQPVTQLLAQTDCFHLPTPTDPLAPQYKEWYHFCIISPGVQAILNLNVSGDTRHAALAGAQVARVVLLIYDRTWDGDVDTIASRDVILRSGEIDVRFGHNTLSFSQGRFELSIALQNRPLTMLLHLQPLRGCFKNPPWASPGCNCLLLRYPASP